MSMMEDGSSIVQDGGGAASDVAIPMNDSVAEMAPSDGGAESSKDAMAPIPAPIIVGIKRDSMDGRWILDSARGQPSMRPYLETLNVPELAIQANEKGESEIKTYHTFEWSTLSQDHPQRIKITKRSRVNNDLVVELTLGEELVEYLKPDDRPKKQLATSEGPGQHLMIESSLLTVNGLAHVRDVKRVVQEENGTVLVQDLTITNDESGKTTTTTRYFIPHEGPMEGDEDPELDGVDDDKMDMEE
jgi:hypothetical protein